MMQSCAAAPKGKIDKLTAATQKLRHCQNRKNIDWNSKGGDISTSRTYSVHFKCLPDYFVSYCFAVSPPPFIHARILRLANIVRYCKNLSARVGKKPKKLCLPEKCEMEGESKAKQKKKLRKKTVHSIVAVALYFITNYTFNSSPGLVWAWNGSEAAAKQQEREKNPHITILMGFLSLVSYLFFFLLRASLGSFIQINFCGAVRFFETYNLFYIYCFWCKNMRLLFFRFFSFFFICWTLHGVRLSVSMRNGKIVPCNTNIFIKRNM